MSNPPLPRQPYDSAVSSDLEFHRQLRKEVSELFKQQRPFVVVLPQLERVIIADPATLSDLILTLRDSLPLTQPIQTSQ